MIILLTHVNTNSYPGEYEYTNVTHGFHELMSLFNNNNNDTGIYNILWENNTIHTGKDNRI